MSDFGSRVALFDTSANRSITFKELDDRSSFLIGELFEREFVFLVAGWTIDCIAFYLGCLKKKIVVALLPSSISASKIVELIRDFNPSYIFCDEKTADKELLDYVALYNSKSRILKTQNNLINEELALLLPTSGSRSKPKFVRISYSNLLTNTDSICSNLNLRDNGKSITTLPMSYSYGLSVLNTHLFVGAQIVLSDKSVINREFWELVEFHKVTNLNGVPSTYQLINRVAKNQFLASSLKEITQAGGAMDALTLHELVRNCDDADIRLYKMYGQTEATARISILPPEELLDSVMSVGYAVKGGTVSLVDDEGREIGEPFNEGEIKYFGGNVALGYAQKAEDLALGDLNHGTLHTGDHGYFDAKGRLYINGRKDRIIKVDGIRLDLDEIERNFKKHNIEAIIVNIGNQLGVFSERTSWTKKRKNFVLNDMSVSPSRINFIVLNKFPRLDSGKMDFVKLQEELQSRTI